MDQEIFGFPLWLRINHFINLFCIFVLMRSGVQILADHPKLYWNDDATPGSEWIKFGKKVMPEDRLWTSMDEAEHIDSVVALPGGHHNLGASRNWHFLIVPVWILNGLWIASIVMIGVVLFHIWATVYTLRNQRQFHVNAVTVIEPPLGLSLADLRALPKQEQITKHNCI